jgi:hypothetical protein
MMRTGVLLLALLAACSSSPEKSTPSSVPKRPGIDQLCLNDCLGNGGRQEFCEERCNY